MIKYLNDRGVVRLTGAITQETVTRLIEAMEHLREDCFLDRIAIEITSPGGEIAAYERLLEFMDALRHAGVKIDTAATGVTGSAAAFLLSTGDDRCASPGCRLRYHLCRVDGQADLTAAAAGDTAAALGDLDARIVRRLAERGVEAATRRREPAAPEDFDSCDWEAIGRFLLVHSKGNIAGMTAHADRLRHLRKAIDEHRGDPASLATLYETLFALDLPLSPVLVRELLLIDAVGSLGAAGRRRPGRSIRVPEWEVLWPDGRVATRYLRRHTLVLGETGSGKTVSGIMPLVNAMLSLGSGVGCALVIDPKRELLPSIQKLAGDDVRVIEPSRPGRQGSMLNLTSAPEWGLDAHMASDRFPDAARQILVRSAGLATQTPARVWAGLSPGHPRSAYWDHQGGSLAALALSLALAVIARRRAIFAGPDSRASILSMPAHALDGLRGFAEGAGILGPQRDLDVALSRALEESSARCAESAISRSEGRTEALESILDDGAASIVELMTEVLGDAFSDDLQASWEASFDRGRELLWRDLDRGRENPDTSAASTLNPEAWDVLAKAVKRTGIYRSDAGFKERFGDFERAVSTSPGDLSLQEAANRIRLCAFVALDDADVRPAPNVMALALRVLDLFLTPARSEDRASGAATEHDDALDFDFSFGKDKASNDDFLLPASHLAKALKPLFGPESESIWQDIRRWETLARAGDRGEASQHYVSILAIAHQAFRDFAASAPAWTLYFGVEPYWQRMAKEGGRDIVDFADAVDAVEGRRTWVVQPALGGDRETIVAKAVKAAFFEAVLGNEARARGDERPLVGYIADEFHRFVTAGEGHGEQGFLDTCRSFGAFCALASQSIASIEHALAGTGGNPDQNAAAVSILLNNVGTKFFFRTTDIGTISRIRSLCPNRPGWPAVVDVRPPSTLAPGECYAALPDGRFERRQLAPCYPGTRTGNSGTKRDSGPAVQTAATAARVAAVVPLFQPGGEV